MLRASPLRRWWLVELLKQEAEYVKTQWVRLIFIMTYNVLDFGFVFAVFYCVGSTLPLASTMFNSAVKQ